MSNQLYISKGWIKQARRVNSPNFNARPKEMSVDAVIIHGISLPPHEFGGPYIEQLFTNQLNAQAHPFFQQIAELKVSAHCLVRRDGEIIQFVNFNHRAWHAGQSQLAGRENCNDFSIGIELEGTDEQAYEAIQYQKLIDIINALLQTYPQISKDRIVGHEQIAPGRKTDPGPFFDWDLFRDALG